MDDMQAIEQRIAGEMVRRAGPSEPVDDLAIFDAVIAANRPKRWGFTMFSALKFVVAGVIVALFGGFLLASVLTAPQGDEMAPAAVTESPSPVTTEELLSGMVTEEVEPGVFRVISDGVRDLAPYLTSMMQTAESPGILAGDDGSVWVGTTPLGGEDVEFPPGWGPIDEFPPGWGPIDFVTADGTAWAARWSHDGERWTEHPEPPAEHVGWQSRDGIVLVAWPDVWPDVPDWDERDERRWTVARLDGDEWRLLGEPLTLPGDAEPEFHVTDDGDLWAWIWSNMDGIWMSRWDDGRWIRDDSRLRHWEGGAIPRWRDHVAPDGSRWEAYDPDWDWDWETDPCPSVVRHDGLREDLFLADVCADSIDVSPDGSVWALARTGPDEDPNLYVITPEAVAGSE